MIRVRFWGTRGSITTPGPTTRRYGGNTPCVELIGYDSLNPGAASGPNGTHLILDAGSGLAPLQESLMGGACGCGKGQLHFFISDYHWDHIIGLPFFAPMFIKGNRVIFHGESVDRLQASIERLFFSDYSPHDGVKNVAATLEYCQIEPDGSTVGEFQISTAKNAHAGIATSFRIDYREQTVVYSTDHQAGDPLADTRLVSLAHGVDLWIMDAHFTPEERLTHPDWGHSSHLESVALAVKAAVKTAVLFHHNPDHSDEKLDAMLVEAKAAASGTTTQVLMARDGLVIDVGSI